MITDVDFSTSRRIIFGPGKLNQLQELLNGLDIKYALFVQKKGLQAVDEIHTALDDMKIESLDCETSGEPDINRIDQIAREARQHNCDCVIGLGGGSVLDTGKAVSAMATNPGKLLDYLEVVGKGNPLTKPALPYLAIPTTAGTGSEVTKNAVISVPEKNVKVSMRDNSLLPLIALVDPQLTYQLPKDITAFTGMDALTQVIEPYLSKASNSMVDLFCSDAIPRAGQFLLRAYQNGEDKEARDNMSWVSLMGGLSLANAKLGAVHGLAGPIGGMFSISHGLICASILSAVMKVNLALLKTENSDKDKLKRFDKVAQWLTGNQSSKAEDGID